MGEHRRSAGADRQERSFLAEGPDYGYDAHPVTHGRDLHDRSGVGLGSCSGWHEAHNIRLDGDDLAQGLDSGAELLALPRRQPHTPSSHDSVDLKVVPLEGHEADAGVRLGAHD